MALYPDRRNDRKAKYGGDKTIWKGRTLLPIDQGNWTSGLPLGSLATTGPEWPDTVRLQTESQQFYPGHRHETH